MAGFDEMKLRDVSEDRLLEILLADLPLGRNTLVGPGDDCAVVQGPGIRGKLLLKTDCVVEGVHYLPEDDPQKVGWKALCRPLSDVAAMGGEPLHALVSIMSPEDRSIAYWRSIYKGLSKAAGRFGVGIVGGETSRSQCVAVSVSLIGRVEGARLDIVNMPGRGRCASCDRELDMDELLTQCPCGNPFLDIVCGRELRIRSVEVN